VYVRICVRFNVLYLYRSILAVYHFYIIEQVFTNQPKPGGARGQHADRRNYTPGKMVIYYGSQDNGDLHVGEVLQQVDDDVLIKQYRERAGKIVPREKEERVNVRLVLPGDFDLDEHQELPAAMKRRALADNWTII
jgi:hypothetical protein